jgi:hypothetical protein
MEKYECVNKHRAIRYEAEKLEWNKYTYKHNINGAKDNKKQYFIANREKIRKDAKIYYLANKERLNEYSKKYIQNKKLNSITHI